MYTFNLTDLVPYDFGADIQDPRGGPVPDLNQAFKANSLHVPYRSPSEVNFSASGRDPQGRILSVMLCLPGFDSDLNVSSGVGAFKSLAKKTEAPGGYAAQQPWIGLDYGVTI